MKKILLLYELLELCNDKEKNIIIQLIDSQEKLFLDIKSKKFTNLEYRSANSFINRIFREVYNDCRIFLNIDDDDDKDYYYEIIGLPVYYDKDYWFYKTKEYELFQLIILNNNQKKESLLKNENKKLIKLFIKKELTQIILKKYETSKH